ncbi:MAG: HPr family phosphocarrier protein [Candidatus Aerophobetes bacterium]|nr:HPr family phosphocarrier protein [Candidatus Aerophobetes bacterium]
MKKRTSEKRVKITNKVGLHIRPASLLVEAAQKFKSKIWIEKDGQKFDGKSVTNLLLISAEKGSEVNIKAEGADAPEAVKTLANIVKNKFGEE